MLVVAAISFTAASASAQEPPAVTKAYSVDAADFSPYDADAARLFRRDALGNLTTDAAGATVCMTAALHLPDGAVMKKISVTFSSAASGDVFFHLRRRSLPNFNLEEIVNKLIPEDDEHIKSASVAIPRAKATVANALYGYPLVVCFGKSDVVAGFQVSYQ